MSNWYSESVSTEKKILAVKMSQSMSAGETGPRNYEGEDNSFEENEPRNSMLYDDDDDDDEYEEDDPDTAFPSSGETDYSTPSEYESDYEVASFGLDTRRRQEEEEADGLGLTYVLVSDVAPGMIITFSNAYDDWTCIVEPVPRSDRGLPDWIIQPSIYHLMRQHTFNPRMDCAFQLPGFVETDFFENLVHRVYRSWRVGRWRQAPRAFMYVASRVVPA